MDYNKIRLTSYIPIYEKYFEMLKNEKSITDFVSFFKHDSRLIFYDNDFVGFYKTMYRDDDSLDREIYIGLIEKYRGKGIAKYVINLLTSNIFYNDPNCEFIHLSIDKDNISSIKLAHSCGFVENEELEKELRENNDNRTLVFSIQNQFYKEEKKNNMTL